MRIKLTIRNFTAIILTAVMLLLTIPAFADTELGKAANANSRDTADYEYYDEPEEIGTITENGNVSSGHIGGDMAETQGNQYTESDGFNGWCYTSVNVIAGSSEYMFEGNDGITWVSEDPDQTIATIGSMDAGMYHVVYGNKPGKAVFLISKTVNGVKQTVRCTVTVRLASGVYYFNSKYKNSSGNSYRLDLKGGWVDNNNTIQTWESGTGEPTNRNQLFKIKYIGSGKYSIRSMVKNSMGMTNYAGIVANSSVGYTHDGVPEASRWCIEPIPDSNGNPSGYRIYSTYSGGEKTITLSGTTNGTPAALSNSFSQSNSMQVWDITKAKTRYNGVTIGRSNNINIYKTYIGDGDSYIYTPAAYSSSENNNGSGTYTWSVTNGTGRAYVSSSGRLTGTSPGAVTLKLAYGSYSDSITVTILPLGEGQYFLENRKSGKRADIYGPYMTAGTVIHQWSIHSGNSQKWQFRILGDGYYTIRSVNSGSNFYIGVDNDSADQDAAVVLRSGTITDGMKFNVEIISDGVYKLIPKTGQSAGRVLAVSTSNSNANGTAVKQLAYKSDTTYNDEWLIYESIMSYINYYDSSMPTADLAYISSANQLANKVYGDIYNVHFKMDGAAKRYTAAKTDMCSTGQNTPCDNNICGSNCFGDHHKNINAISNQLYNGSRETNHLYVLWTDRPSETYCYENRSGAHERFSRNALAVVCGSRPVIHMMDIVGTSAADREALMAITLVHETAHSFGMPDVYNNAGHDDPNNFICVMEAYDLEGGDKYYNKIKKNASLAFCDSCKASLESLVPTKVIRGN